MYQLPYIVTDRRFLQMAHITGPQFIALQVEDLEAAKRFYTEQLGLLPTEQGPEHAVVFQTSPIPFAIRTPSVDLAGSTWLGLGVALWLGCEQAGRQPCMVGCVNTVWI
jgi:catechol 2,3-dioxygenase-like lactoylglutathione lyase family enzyme